MRACDARFDFALTSSSKPVHMRSGSSGTASRSTSPRKGRQDMASEADVSTETSHPERLASPLPGRCIPGGGDRSRRGRGADGIWVVDPIDGTQPFVHGLTSWCVSIAFVCGHAVEMGFVDAPARDELFIGRRGESATLNGKPIAVCDATRLDEGILGSRLLAPHRGRRHRPAHRSSPASRRDVLPRRLGHAGPLLRRLRAATGLRRTSYPGLGFARGRGRRRSCRRCRQRPALR